MISVRRPHCFKGLSGDIRLPRVPTQLRPFTLFIDTPTGVRLLQSCDLDTAAWVYDRMIKYDNLGVIL